MKLSLKNEFIACSSVFILSFGGIVSYVVYLMAINNSVSVKQSLFISLFVLGSILFSGITSAVLFLIFSKRFTVLKQEFEDQFHELQKFKLAVKYASDHILITDSEGIILYVNKAAEAITGYSKKEIIGKRAGSKDLWGGQMKPEFYKKMWETIKIKKHVFKGEFTNKRKNGQLYISQASISPVLNAKKEVIFFVGIERDITHEKEVDKMKTEFISLASHQLRTPLSAMKWFLEMLSDGDVGELNKEQQEMVKNVYDSNQRMISLVNGLLSVSRIESGKIIIDPKLINLSNLIKEILTEMKPLIQEKNLKFVVNLHENVGEILVDPNLIREVYRNLISNAVKYSKSTGKVAITLTKDHKNVIFKISDKGLGIPQNEKSKIFQKFHRAINAQKSIVDGSGLGLYLVKSIVESSNGKIWFESEENKGSTFWFTLPLTGMNAKKGS